MKLIDLLKQELPKHGGWPEGVDSLSQGGSGRIYRDGFMSDFTVLFIISETADDWDTAIITREQYEASPWVPPVGTECEYQDYKGNWYKIFIIARYGDIAFIEWRSDTYTGCDLMRGYLSPDRFRPLRTERDKAIEEMCNVGLSLPAGIRFTVEEMGALYDAGYRKV